MQVEQRLEWWHIPLSGLLSTASTVLAKSLFSRFELVLSINAFLWLVVLGCFLKLNAILLKLRLNIFQWLGASLSVAVSLVMQSILLGLYENRSSMRVWAGVVLQIVGLLIIYERTDKKQMNISQLVGLNQFYRTIQPDSLSVGINNGHAFVQGAVVSVGYFKFAFLDKSDSHKVNNSHLKQVCCGFLMNLPLLAPDLLAQKMTRHLKEEFRNANINVFVFKGGELQHTSCKGTKGWCQIRKAENKKFNHDLLIILA